MVRVFGVFDLNRAGYSAVRLGMKIRHKAKIIVYGGLLASGYSLLAGFAIAMIVDLNYWASVIVCLCSVVGLAFLLFFFLRMISSTVTGTLEDMEGD